MIAFQNTCNQQIKSENSKSSKRRKIFLKFVLPKWEKQLHHLSNSDDTYQVLNLTLQKNGIFLEIIPLSLTIFVFFSVLYPILSWHEPSSCCSITIALAHMTLISHYGPALPILALFHGSPTKWPLKSGKFYSYNATSRMSTGERMLDRALIIKASITMAQCCDLAWNHSILSVITDVK